MAPEIHAAENSQRQLHTDRRQPANPRPADDVYHTTEALNAGVAIIYQELHLIPEMTVAENIYLGQLPHKGGIVNRSLLNYEAGLQLKHLGLDIDPETPLKYLSIGQWQMVEIAKALARNAKIIAFDEPTSSLGGKSKTCFGLSASCEEGRVIIYVTAWKRFLR
jgi:L-arabinose transport system ATP-binding protein